ncbi:MAG TPA: ATP-binding cassette domain-containing protein, partial [Burkholderiaceae bacterium]
MSAAAATLSVAGLSKRYGDRVALDGVSMALQGGTFATLLGPNGAGKSTLFQLLTGLFVPDAGQIEVAGHSMQRAATRALRHIGVVFQQMSLDLDLTVRANLQFHADLHGLPRADALQRIVQGCQGAGLVDDLERPVRELSGGNRRKVELVR